MKLANPLFRCLVAACALVSVAGMPAHQRAVAATQTSPVINCGAPAEFTDTVMTGTVSSRVVDAVNAQPLAGIRVVLCVQTYIGGSVSAQHTVTTTDSLGRFSFANLPSGVVPSGTGMPGGYRTFLLYPLAIEARADYEVSETQWDGKLAEIPEIVVRKGANITGQVSDFVAGFPVSNIMIVAARQDPNGPVTTDTPNLVGLLRGAIYTTTVTVSGTYTLTNLPTGAFDIYAMPLSQNYSGEIIKGVQAQSPFTAAGVNFVLKRTARVFGRVRNTRGDAVSNVVMYLVSDDPAQPVSNEFATDTDGSFEMRARDRVPLQRIVVSGTYPYLGQIIFQPITFSVGSNTEMTVTVYEPGIIRGVARYASGRPALNHQIDLVDPTRQFSNGTPGCSPSALTLGDGGFTLCGIHPSGTYYIAVIKSPGVAICSVCPNPLVAGYYGGSQLSTALPLKVTERQISAGIVITIPDPIYLPLIGGSTQ